MLDKLFSFKGGIFPKHHKNTEGMETKTMPLPSKIVVPLVQHIGAPLQPTVKKNDIVKVGQVIADSDAFVSAPIHSSVSGKVKEIKSYTLSNGMNSKVIVIEPDGEQTLHEFIKPKKYNTRDEFIHIIRESGLVGLGGAGFPAHVKLSPPKDKTIDTLIINGAECEPYITSDYREVMENSWNIVSGIEIVMEQLNIENVIIGIEDNKPEAIKELEKVAGKNDNISVARMKSKYPQGAEKMLIKALTDRVVPMGKLPADVGCIVMNINSISFIAEHIKTGIPLVKKRVTVDGNAILYPSNVFVPIGTPIKEMIDAIGGFKVKPKKVIMGGPMMGVSQYNLDDPIMKYTNAILAFDEEQAILPKQSACIRCGKCVEVCPMNLLPFAIDTNYEKGFEEDFGKLQVMNCIECGSCAYTCPSKRHLVQSIRMAKLAYKKQLGGKK